MLRKNRGSILIITVFVFLLVNIITITCSALILSNNKYTKYNYEEIYIKEQCLSKIELVYSNILNEVEIALNQSEDSNTFQNYFIDNDSYDFINRINNISGVSLKDTKCEINRVEIDNESDSIYYRIISKVKYQSFSKSIVAYIKIENPFNEEKVDKNQDVNKIEDDEDNKIKQNEEKTNLDSTSNLELIQESESTNEDIEKDQIKNENIEINDFKKDIKPSDLVTLFNCKEV